MTELPDRRAFAWDAAVAKIVVASEDRGAWKLLSLLDSWADGCRPGEFWLTADLDLFTRVWLAGEFRKVPSRKRA